LNHVSIRNTLIGHLQSHDPDAPWFHNGKGKIYDSSDIPVAHVSPYHEKQIPLVASAPELLGALRGLVGLTELLRLRDDLPVNVYAILASNHRVRDAIAAIAKAENKGELESRHDGPVAAAPIPAAGCGGHPPDRWSPHPIKR
jgi:hypothetical protein